MSTLRRKATIYFDPNLHNALHLKSVRTSRSVSALVNDAIRFLLAEDAEDLAAFEERADEPLIPFEDVLKELRYNGRI